MTAQPKPLTPVGRRWATLSEAADYAGVSVATMKRQLWAGQLTRHKFGGRVLVDLDQLDALIEASGADGDR